MDLQTMRLTGYFAFVLSSALACARNIAGLSLTFTHTELRFWSLFCFCSVLWARTRLDFWRIWFWRLIRWEDICPGKIDRHECIRSCPPLYSLYWLLFSRSIPCWRRHLSTACCQICLLCLFRKDTKSIAYFWHCHCTKATFRCTHDNRTCPMWSIGLVL